MKWLRAYVTTMRPYLLFVSGIVGLTGLALGQALPLAQTVLLATVFFLSYGFGQALTDVFQTDTDAISAPYRPLVRGEIRPGDVMVVSLAGLLASGLVIARFNARNVVVAAAIVAGLYSYTWFKRRWWGGPFWNAWIVAALAVAALLCAGTAVAGQPALLATLGVVFFGYANFVLTGYWKDVSADTATGYRTLPVVFGLRRAAVVADVLAATEIACALLAIRAVPAGPDDLAWALSFLLPGMWQVVRAQVLLRRVTEDIADVAIAPVLHGYILLLCGLASLLRPAWMPALWLYFVLWAVMLRLRPARAQI